MMDRFGVPLRRVPPSLQRFEDEEVVFVDKAGVGDPAFEVGEALDHQRRCDAPRPRRSQADRLELADVAAQQLPTCTTLAASAGAGIAITHSRVARSAAKL